jgi:hypothetical protein
VGFVWEGDVEEHFVLSKMELGLASNGTKMEVSDG